MCNGGALCERGFAYGVAATAKGGATMKFLSALVFTFLAFALGLLAVFLWVYSEYYQIVIDLLSHLHYLSVCPVAISAGVVALYFVAAVYDDPEMP